MKKYFTVKNLCLSGIIAALYAGLTILLQAISFSAVQVRVSEAMTLLPIPQEEINRNPNCVQTTGWESAGDDANNE